MRRIVFAFLTTLTSLVMLFSYHTSLSSTAAVAGTSINQSPTQSSTTASGSPPENASSESTTSSSSTATTTGAKTYTGPATDTRWGIVQVQITVVNGKITQSVAIQYPNGNGRDAEINSQALPILASEVIKAQSAKIDTVSGATVTSDGYLTSLQAAVDQAHL